jgi:hypothetical protein
MNADKYKSAFDGVRFSPDFQINLKRRLKGETLIAMTPAKKSPFQAAALAGMSIAACFICFFAVKIASERLDSGLVSEPAVTSFETILETPSPENGTTVIGTPRQASDRFGFSPAADAAPENSAESTAPPVGAAAPGLYAVYGTGTPAVSDIQGTGTYRPEVALEGLLAAFDSGTFVVSDGEFKTTEASTTVNYESNKTESSAENDIADDAATALTDTAAFSDTVRAYLAQVVKIGESKNFAEHETGEQQYRIDINGDDGTLLYSVWVFDNCVLVERFAPDGLMKAYIEMTG